MWHFYKRRPSFIYRPKLFAFFSVCLFACLFVCDYCILQDRSNPPEEDVDPAMTRVIENLQRLSAEEFQAEIRGF